MRTGKIPWPAAALSLLAGCTVGPDYQQPALDTPTQWNTPLAGGEAAQVESLATWWKSFNDAVLDSLIERAMQANFDLRIAEARVRQARAQYAMIEGAWGPTVDAGASYARQRSSTTDNVQLPPTLTQPYNLYQAGFDASWEIDVFGGTRRSVEAAEADVAAAQFNRENVLVTVLGEVARNYIEARGAQRRLVIARKNIQIQKDALTQTRERYQQGLASYVNVQQVATMLAMTQAEVPPLETDFQASVHRLDILLGEHPGALHHELAQAAPVPAAPPEVPVGLPSELLRRRPDVRQAERELAAQTARIGVATAELFPKFYLTGAAGFMSVNAGSWFGGDSQFWSLGPTVQWRIFDAGRIRSNIRLQKAIQEETLARYEKTVLMSFEDVEHALVAYANEQLRRQSLAQAVASGKEAWKSATQRYASGDGSFLEVLEVERALYDSENQLAQSDEAVSVSLVMLYKALGGGWQTEPPLSAEPPADTVAQVSPSEPRNDSTPISAVR